MSENLPSDENSGSLFDRVKGILLEPGKEWPKIVAENREPKDIALKYVLILAAIAPICTFIGFQLFGFGVLGVRISGLTGIFLRIAIAAFVINIAMVFVLGFAAKFASKQFGGKDDFPAGFRLAAYSMTAAWVAGIFTLLPQISFLQIVGLYSIYLLYLGAAPVMGVPKEKAAPFTGVVFVIGIVAGVILYTIMQRLAYPSFGNLLLG